MERKNSLSYFYIVILLMFIAPAISVLVEITTAGAAAGIWDPIGKWFVFWAVGVRLLTAGIRQAVNPAFTAEEIFLIKNGECHSIVRELGFANISIGLLGSASLFIPQWRMAAAFLGGIYLGIAGIQHAVRKPSDFNEGVAMLSDLFIFAVMAMYIISSFLN